MIAVAMTVRDPYLTPPTRAWKFPRIAHSDLAARFEGQSRETLKARAFHVVPVATLAKLCDPLRCWMEQDSPITAEEVHACLAAGTEALTETPLWIAIALGHTPVTEAENRQRHVQKVAYFVRHAPHEPISVDVGCPHFGFFPTHIVEDGHHRLAGSILAGTRFIAVQVAGEVEEAKQLKLWNPTPEEQELYRRDLHDTPAPIPASVNAPRHRRQP